MDHVVINPILDKYTDGGLGKLKQHGISLFVQHVVNFIRQQRMGCTTLNILCHTSILSIVQHGICNRLQQYQLPEIKNDTMMTNVVSCVITQVLSVLEVSNDYASLHSTMNSVLCRRCPTCCLRLVTNHNGCDWCEEATGNLDNNSMFTASSSMITVRPRNSGGIPKIPMKEGANNDVIDVDTGENTKADTPKRDNKSNKISKRKQAPNSRTNPITFPDSPAASCLHGMSTRSKQKNQEKQK
jgi:hypothetical protein